MSVENSFNSSSSQFSFEESNEYNNFQPTTPKIVFINLFDKNNLIKEKKHSENCISERIPELNKNNKRALDVFNVNIQKTTISESQAPQCKKKKLYQDNKKENFLSFWSRVREQFPKESQSCIPKDNVNDIHEWIKKNSSELEKIQSLNLCGLGLTEIPSEIQFLPFLCVLEASLNKIIKIPEQIYNLTNLQILSLESNRLEEVSPSIKKLTLLEELVLTNNVLEDLPNEIQSLARLRILKLGNNFLEEIPDSLGSLGNLRELFLDNNQIKNISQLLENMFSLNVLNLKNNCISDIPIMLSALKELKYIDISKNNLELIPDYYTKMLKFLNSLKNVRSFNY